MSDHEKPCPFCGSTNLKWGGDDKIVKTWCLNCEATGPNHYGRHEWNDRADRIEELEAKLAADRTEVIALIRKDAENGDISHGAAQWVIDTILAELKGQ